MEFVDYPCTIRTFGKQSDYKALGKMFKELSEIAKKSNIAFIINNKVIRDDDIIELELTEKDLTYSTNEFLDINQIKIFHFRDLKAIQEAHKVTYTCSQTGKKKILKACHGEAEAIE